MLLLPSLERFLEGGVVVVTWLTGLAVTSVSYYIGEYWVSCQWSVVPCPAVSCPLPLCQLFYVQLSDVLCPAVSCPLSSCPAVHLSSCPAVQLSSCPAVQLSSCLAVSGYLSSWRLSAVLRPTVSCPMSNCQLSSVHLSVALCPAQWRSQGEGGHGGHGPPPKLLVVNFPINLRCYVLLGCRVINVILAINIGDSAF